MSSTRLHIVMLMACIALFIGADASQDGTWALSDAFKSHKRVLKGLVPITYAPPPRVCGTGNYLNTNTGKCVDCPTGQFQSQEGSETACTPCPAGSYQDTTGRAACKLCAAKTYNAATGQTSASACKACATGPYGVMGQTSCAPSPASSPPPPAKSPPPPPPPKAAPVCAAGTALNVGTNTCVNCPTGQFQNLAGQTTCTACPAGSYQDTTGRPACKLCAAKTYQNLTGQTYCKSCPSARNAGTGATTCAATSIKG